MTYSVKEIYYTLQGEGAHTGRAAVFLRFAGCNLWSGVEKDRAEALCRFCDTDFVGTDGPGGGKFANAAALARAVFVEWPTQATGKPYVDCTGGEPLLQLDRDAIDALHENGFEIGIETNGTLLPPPEIDWICVSPKADAEQRLMRGNELKLIYPQDGAPPERFAGLDFQNFFLQPMDNADRAANTEAAMQYCLEHPQWRLSLQTHKLIGIR
ncbi:MAG: 7-carboxy-7-deazaguanine synthase [Alphaproteobacteria bacterium]|nr:7-carboxy-7-deazaguanine synthase [Alphaproteobacteria bacterium]